MSIDMSQVRRAMFYGSMRLAGHHRNPVNKAEANGGELGRAVRGAPRGMR